MGLCPKIDYFTSATMHRLFSLWLLYTMESNSRLDHILYLKIFHREKRGGDFGAETDFEIFKQRHEKIWKFWKSIVLCLSQEASRGNSQRRGDFDSVWGGTIANEKWLVLGRERRASSFDGEPYCNVGCKGVN